MQVRKWRGWQHHMALLGAALVFTLKERERTAKSNPLTSVRDVVETIAWYCEVEPTPEQVATTIRQRHCRRKLSMDNKRHKDHKR